MVDEDASRDAVEIERTYDAPVDLVWRMWTDPAHFQAWYGPEGATVSVAEMDVRVGGARRVCMQVVTPRGPVEMWFAGRHLEVIEPTRLVYTEAMTDEHGNALAPSEAGMPPGHPATTEVRIELEAVAARTRLRLTHVGVPTDSPGAAGWATALDKLAVSLAAQVTR
jgi:uncharacterized protein YndB with AHSA1/START domain